MKLSIRTPTQLFVRTLAVLLWFPGLAIQVNDLMISVYDAFIVLSLPYTIVIMIQRRITIFSILTLLPFITGLLFSNNITRSLPYFYYYCAFVLPSMLVSLAIFRRPEPRQAFIQSFVSVALWMAPLAVVQFALPFPVNLVNNSNFSLQLDAVHRSQLFCPEASILAALLVVAMAVVLFNTITKVDPRIPRGFLPLVLLFLGLASTLSSSVIVLLPLIVIIIFYFGGARLSRVIPYTLIGSVAVAAFYGLAYVGRVNSGDAGGSVIVRTISVMAGLKMFTSHWLVGNGLGSNREVAYQDVYLFERWLGYPVFKPGIDSFQIALMNEMGVIAALLSGFALIILFRRARDSRIQSGQRILAVFGAVVWVVAFFTTGYRGLQYCWLFFPAAYAVGLARPQSVGQQIGRRAHPAHS